MSENRDRLERALEILVYAPIGVGLYLADVAPPIVETIVARGRAEVDRRQSEVQRHVTSARSLGQVALAFGLPKFRGRVERMVSSRFAPPTQTSRPRAATTAPPSEAADRQSTARPVAVAAERSAPAPGNDAAPARDALPIPGYDALSASQVVERLTGLGRAELEAVHVYETAHRHRRTILGKIEQLAG